MLNQFICPGDADRDCDCRCSVVPKWGRTFYGKQWFISSQVKVCLRVKFHPTPSLRLMVYTVGQQDIWVMFNNCCHRWWWAGALFKEVFQSNWAFFQCRANSQLHTDDIVLSQLFTGCAIFFNPIFLLAILKTCRNWSGDSFKSYATSYLNEAYCFTRKTCDFCK